LTREIKVGSNFEIGFWETPRTWDEEADVVIIGSGCAGLSAAYEARKGGASVVVLEKLKVPGGNSIISGGLVAAAGSPLQAKEGIQDAPELLYRDMLKAGLNLNHPELATIVAENSYPIVEWTIQELGVKYLDKLMHLGGHSVPRSYFTKNMCGSAIVRRQLSKLSEAGITVRTRNCLSRLFRTTDGEMHGVQVDENYSFETKRGTSARNIRARRAVIIATGGFSEDVGFRSVQDPLLTSEIESTNRRGATAEGLVETLRIGAMPVQLSWIQMAPWTSPDEKGYGLAVNFNVGVAFPYGIMIDPGTGRRFVNELDAQIKLGHPSLTIADGVAASHREKLLLGMLKRGVVKRFETLDDLAKFHEIPLQPLLETVRQYNEYVNKKIDLQYGKYLPKDAMPIERSPFYSCRVSPKVHHTMGGLHINREAQVMDLKGEPIKRLYAAGEVCGGIHGASRLGSCAIAECLIFGRISGKNAAVQPMH
jgi:flavocytochrome c